MDNRLTGITFLSLPHKRYQDHRGWAFFPFDQLPETVVKGLNIESLHLVMSEPGAVRGNHVHPETGEWLCVFGGPARFFWEEEGKVRVHDLDDESTLIHIPAGTGHAIKNIGTKSNYLLAFRETVSRGEHTVNKMIVGSQG